MAATTVENLEFHIKKTGMGDDGAKILKSWADAFNEIKKASKGNPISKTLVKNISALAGAMKAIDAAAVSKMRQLAAALKTFDGLKGISLNAKFAGVVADIAAAADLLNDSHIDKLTRLGNALKNMQGAKTNIGDMLSTQIVNLASAVDSITDETVNRLNRLTKALSRLRGVDLRGLGAVMAEQRKAESMALKQTPGRTSRAGNQSDGGGSDSSIQWTWSLSKNATLAKNALADAAAQAFNIHPVVKLIASVLGGIVKTVFKIAAGIAKWTFNMALSALKKIWSLIQNISKSVVRIGADIAKGLARNVSNISKALASGVKNLAQFSASHSIVSQVTDAFGKLKKLFSSFPRVALYRLARGAIEEITDAFKAGAENAYFYAKKFGNATQYIAASLDLISSGHFKMSNQLGAAWTTMLATIEPILIQIISMVTKAAEVVTQFFAVLSGHGTYLKAKDYTKAWADETEKGANAAKEWKNQLMDFDTLNRLNEPMESTTKAAEKYKDYENMFDEVPIESWLEKLKNLESFELGEKIAEWLNGVLKRLDDWFLQLRPKLKGYAKELADLLNGFIKGFDWPLLGKTVADGLNAVFDGISTFLKNAKWKQLGRGVGDSIKSLFDHTEWDLIGETFANKWNALLHFIEGVVTTPGIWQSMGKAVGKFARSLFDTIDINSMATSAISIINGVADAVGSFLDQNPFQNLAAKISQALNRVVMEVEWAKLGTNLGRLFQSGLNVLFDVVSKFPFEKLGWNIMQCIDNLAAQINFDQLGHLMMSIGLALWKVVYGAVEYLADTGGAKRLAERLSSFVVGALNELSDWIRSLSPAKIATALSDFFGNIQYAQIKEAFVSVIKAAWRLAVDTKDLFLQSETGQKIISKLKEIFGGLTWMDISATIREKLSEAWTWACARFDEIWPPKSREAFAAAALAKIEEIGKQIGAALWKGITSKVDEIKESSAFKIISAINDALNPAAQAKNIWELVYNTAKLGGQWISMKLGDGVEEGSPNLEVRTTKGLLDAITSASFKADSVAVTAGTNAMTSAANGVISGKPKVQTAMDGSLVQPADSAVVAFLKKIGIIQSAYAEEAGGWISTADQVKERTVGDYDVIGDKVPKSMDVMQGNLDKTTVLVAKSFQTMDTMSVQAAQSMRDKLKTAFDAAKQSVLNVAQAIDTSMVSMMSSVGTKFVEGARNLIGNIKSFIDSVKSTLGIGGGGSSVFSNIGQSMVSGMSQGFSSLWGTFSSNAVTLVSTLAQTIVSAVNAAITSAAGNITNMVSQAKSTLSNLASNARESISNIVSSSQSTLNNIVSQVGSALNNLISQANAKLQSLRGKSYATGGFPEDGLFFANHSELVGQFSNGRTAVANNAQIIEGIKRGVMEAMQASLSNINNRSGDDQAINIYIGDELVYSGYAQWNRRQQFVTGGRA